MKKQSEEEVSSGLEKKENSKNSYSVEVALSKETVSELIKALRKNRKFSQEKLGELIGVQKSQVSKLEKGSNNITLGTMIKIFTALKAQISIKVDLDKKQDLKIIGKLKKEEEKK